MARGEGLCAPDLLALSGGDAVDVGPLHGGGDDTWASLDFNILELKLTWLAADMLGVTVAGGHAWGAIGQLAG